jgi:gliding motility-associated-like protein
VNVVFGSAGVDTLFCFGSNACGSKLGFRKITVKDYPIASIGNDTAICIGSSITLFNSQTDPAWTYAWSPSSPTITNDSITVSPTVTTDYIVRVTNPPSCIRRDTITVTVEQPDITTNVDSFCIGSTLTLDALTANANSYLWNDSSTAPQLTVSDTGTYSVQVSVTDSVCYDVFNYSVSYVYPTVTDMIDSLCPGTSITLDATTDSATSYLWNDSTTASQLTVSDSGTYSVQIAVPGEMCYRVYTYSLSYSVSDSTLDYIKFCSGESMLLAPHITGTGYSYSWNTGDTLGNIIISAPGNYFVNITSSLWRCPRVENFNVTEEPCESEYNIPNVFTPDGDGHNDIFLPCDDETPQKFNCGAYKNVRDINLKIFSRWGELVFETTDKDIKWNGKKNNNGSDCPDGVYYYTGIVNLIYPYNGKTSNEIHGFITVIRKNK